jgi:threonine dehydratase
MRRRHEILRQTDFLDLDYIFVPIGGGGMIAGIAAVVKALKPSIQVIGVEPSGANAMAQVGNESVWVSVEQQEGLQRGQGRNKQRS